MKTSAIIIDDERKAIATLKSKIERFHGELELIGETTSPEDGISLISTLKPQIVFLDIAMPMMNGFDVLAQIENPEFEIIFVTAFDKYAINAIRHCAIGYLVKPIDNEDLSLAINNALTNIRSKIATTKNKLLVSNIKTNSFQEKNLVIPTRGGYEFVKIETIIHCEGITGYTKIYCTNKKQILSSYNIGYYQRLLSNQPFYLVHKSHLINCHFICSYQNEGLIVLEGGMEVPVSRNKKNDFIHFLKGN